MGIDYSFFVGYGIPLSRKLLSTIMECPPDELDERADEENWDLCDEEWLMEHISSINPDMGNNKFIIKSGGNAYEGDIDKILFIENTFSEIKGFDIHKISSCDKEKSGEVKVLRRFMAKYGVSEDELGWYMVSYIW